MKFFAALCMLLGAVKAENDGDFQFTANAVMDSGFFLKQLSVDEVRRQRHLSSGDPLFRFEVDDDDGLAVTLIVGEFEEVRDDDITCSGSTCIGEFTAAVSGEENSDGCDVICFAMGSAMDGADGYITCPSALAEPTIEIIACENSGDPTDDCSGVFEENATGVSFSFDGDDVALIAELSCCVRNEFLLALDEKGASFEV